MAKKASKKSSTHSSKKVRALLVMTVTIEDLFPVWTRSVNFECKLEDLYDRMTAMVKAAADASEKES